MTSHQDKANPPLRDNFNTARTDDTTNTWLTPLSLIQSLGEFDLDPCCPPVIPWSTAKQMHHYRSFMGPRVEVMTGIAPDQFAIEVIKGYLHDECKDKPRRIEQSYVERERARQAEGNQQEGPEV